MIRSKIKLPLICWKCLSKRVVVDSGDNVICVEPTPFGNDPDLPKECGFTVSRKKWFELAKGSLPKSGRNQEWLIEVVIPIEVLATKAVGA